jgi:hypothetical protein
MPDVHGFLPFGISDRPGGLKTVGAGKQLFLFGFTGQMMTSGGWDGKVRQNFGWRNSR